MKTKIRHAGIAATVGLLAGMLCRYPSWNRASVDGIPSGQKPGAARIIQQSGKNQPAGDAGPTADFLGDIANAPASRCEELFLDLISRKERGSWIMLEAVFRRWMETTEPKELLARLRAEQGRDSMGLWAEPFFNAWASIDYSAARAATPGHSEFSRARAIAAMRRQDPSFLSEVFSIWDYDDSPVVNALAALGRDNPDLAMQVAAYKGGKPDDNADLIAAVARGWATKDPRAALDWVRSLGFTGNDREKALGEVFSEWRKTDAEAANQAMRSTMDEGKNEPQSAETVKPPAAKDLVALGVHVDPFLGVRDLYQKLLESTVDWQEYQSIDRAIDHDSWFCTDPAKAAEEATHLPPGKVRDYLMSCICAQWADRSPNEALAYAKTHGLKPPYVRDEPDAEMVRAALSSPDKTLSPIFAKDDTNSKTYQQALKLATKRAEISPEDTVKWLMSQPEEVTYDRQSSSSIYLKGLLDSALGYHWVLNDARSATQWLMELPDGKRKTEAWLAMNHYTCEYNPDLAFTLTAGLLQDGPRAEMLESNLKRAVEKIGMPAARELLRIPNLSAEERTSLGKALDGLTTQPAKP